MSRRSDSFAYIYRKRRWKLLFGAVDRAGGLFSRPLHGVPDLSDARSIVVLKLDQLGDVVLAQPLLAALRRAAPGARIRLAVGRGRAEIASRLEGPDSVIELPIVLRPGETGLKVNLAGLRRDVAELRRARPDVVIAAKEEPLTVLLARLIGARRRIGFREGGLGFLLTHAVPVAAREHQSAVLAALAGATGAIDPPTLIVRDEDRDAAARIVRDAGFTPDRPLVVVHPGSGNPARRWPWNRVAECVRRVAAACPASFVILRGDEIDPGPPPELEPPSRIRDVDTTTNLAALVGLIDRADLFLGNESGPAHIAAAVGTPAVVPFFSGNDPKRWGPAGGRTIVVEGAPGSPPEVAPVVDACLELLRGWTAAPAAATARAFGDGPDARPLEPEAHDPRR